MSILNEKLKSFDYYIQKLPLYLQNSYGIIDQFKMWYDVLTNSTTISDDMLLLLNIFDNDYIAKINSLKNHPSDTTDMLDKLAALFGFERNLIVTYYDDDSQQDVTETLSLNDEEILLLIKAKIIQSYFDGTREQVIQLYELLNLRVYYITTGDANCEIYLAKTTSSEFDYSENIQKMFLARMLNLESMGIKYSFSVIDMERLLIWDKPVDENYTGWDGGVWSL